MSEAPSPAHRLSAQPPYCRSAFTSAWGEPTRPWGQRLTACDGTNWCPAASGKLTQAQYMSLFCTLPAALNQSCPLMHLCFCLSFWTLRCWFLRQCALSRSEGTKWETGKTRKFRFSLVSLLCNTGAIHQSAIFNSVYLCSASAPKGHTQLHCKWCKLQAETCVFGGISTLGWHLASRKKKPSLLERENFWTSHMKKESKEM